MRSLPSLLLLTALAATSAHAQTVQGRAVDRQTLQPLVGASMALVDASGTVVATASSATDGTFSVTAPAAGEYRLAAGLQGYRTMLSGVVPLGMGEVVEVEARVSPEVAEPVAAGPEASGPMRPGISGVLVDNGTGRPLADARVTLRDGRERTVARTQTDSAGAFHLRVSSPGGFTLLSERAGYLSAESGVMTLTPDDTVRVELRMGTDAVVLAPLTVVSSSAQVMRDYHLAGFEWRRERQPWGRFMDRDQIKRLNPFYASDVLQHVPSVQVHGGFDRVVTLPMRSRGSGARCVPNLYVDGRMVRLGGGDFTLDGMVRGGGMAGVEVYVSPQMAPGEFPAIENPLCGVVVIWTEVYGGQDG